MDEIYSFTSLEYLLGGVLQILTKITQTQNVPNTQQKIYSEYKPYLLKRDYIQNGTHHSGMWGC